MTATRAAERDYAERGDYHRHLDPHWSYAPIYVRKVRWADEMIASLPRNARLLDVGAGEGALVERYREQGRDIVGVDSAYESAAVKKADLLALPFEDDAFDVVLLLDVLEHVELLDQPKALSEIARVLDDDGVLLMSVPNLAHFHSRLKFLLAGKLTRTSAVERHPGDRPLAEYEELLRETGFRIESRRGIFPTLPLVFRLVNRRPQTWGWMVGVLDAVLPFPGLSFLVALQARKVGIA